jgi:hypothetical protein
MTSLEAPVFVFASPELRFAFATAAFADVLRGTPDAETWKLEAIRAFAAGAAGSSEDRQELVKLVSRAIELRARS